MDCWLDHAALGRLTGMVVPAYFSAAPSDDLVRRLLWMTLGDCRHYLPLRHVWVVVDGDPRTLRLVDEVRRRLGEGDDTFHLMALPENEGKFAAMRHGMRGLLSACPDVRYAVVRQTAITSPTCPTWRGRPRGWPRPTGTRTSSWRGRAAAAIGPWAGPAASWRPSLTA